MTALQAAILSNVLASGALAITFFHLWRLDRNDTGPVFWALGYLANAIRLIFLVLGWDRIAPVYLLNDFFSAVVPLLWVAGTCKFVGRKVPYRWLVGACIGLAGITTTMRAHDMSAIVILAPQIVFVTVTLSITSFAFFRLARGQLGGRWG